MLTQSGLSTWGWSGDTRGLGNPESRGLAGGDEIRIQIWQYIPMYPAIIGYIESFNQYMLYK